MKKVGITCGISKIEYFRKRLIQEGYVLLYDGKSGIPHLHLFSVEVPTEKYKSELQKISSLIKRMNEELIQINYHHGN
jgi:hypothetical protein